jgi:dihydroneopterin aldolase
MEQTVKLTGMKFYAYHGVSPQETSVGNYFTVDISYAFPMKDVFESDDLRDVINYAEVYEAVKAEMERPSRLLEHVAGRILRLLEATFPQLTHIKLTLSKLNPPLGGEVYSASVTLESGGRQNG